MFDAGTLTDIATIVGSIITGAIASVLGFRKMLRHWEREGLEIERSNAEESLIKSLRVESERMAQQNQRLMDQLATLQMQIGELHTSINRLRTENDTLHRQITDLHKEISEVKSGGHNGRL